MKKILCFLPLITLLLIGCKKKEEEIKVDPQIQELSFTPYFGNEPIQNPNQIFEMDNGWRVKLNGLKFLFTEIKLGGTTFVDAAYYEFPNDYNNVFYRKEVASTMGAGLKLLLGVNESDNHADPSAFPVDSPLNILNASDMHWSWNPGYIFYKMDFIADTLNVPGEDNFNHIISYHIGLDNNLKTVDLSEAASFEVNAATRRLRMKVDFKAFLLHSNSIIDLSTEAISHSTGPQANIAVRVANHLPDFFTSY